MKGIVFTECIDMVVARCTSESADRMLTAAAVPSDGTYTAVGTYDNDITHRHGTHVRFVLTTQDVSA